PHRDLPEALSRRLAAVSAASARAGCEQAFRPDRPSHPGVVIDTEDRIAELRWFDEGGSFSRFPNQAEEIEMTDVRRTGPPRRLEDRTRYGIPIEGEVDGIWQRAFHVTSPSRCEGHDVPGAEFFEK